MIENNVGRKIYIVGSGPGDPDLLTVKAMRLIKSAEVILHDNLISEGILQLANENCLLINIGKRAGDGIDQDTRQKKIVHEIIKYSKSGKRVIRLKGGDPMIFGRGIEEYLELNKNNIEVEIVPGITAGIAVGSLGIIPLTQRSKVESLLITTGSTIKEFTRKPELLISTLKSGNTVIIYMGHLHLNELKQLCSQNNIEEDLPIVAVSNISLENQSIIWSTLNAIEEKINEHQMERPMIFIIGRNVKDYTNNIMS
jgi:uroporphyrin-III C-methyltransferase